MEIATPSLVTDIMTREVVSVRMETPLVEAAKILANHNFDGVPVVDAENRLIGIVTEYDLISKDMIHLPTLQVVLNNLQVFKKDQAQFDAEIKKLSNLKVKDVANTEPLTLNARATYEDVLTAFREHHRVNPIPVVDDDKTVIGVVSRFDVLRPLQAVAERHGKGAQREPK